MSVIEMPDRVFDSVRFREVVGRFPTGVAVVAAARMDRTYGLAVASFVSLSLEPPLVLFCADHGSTSWPGIRAAGRFGVSILAEDQRDLCQRFAAKVDDKFEGISWSVSPLGSPLIDGALAWLDCTIVAVHTAGDHDVVIGRVASLDASEMGRPLLFFRSEFGSVALHGDGVAPRREAQGAE